MKKVRKFSVEIFILSTFIISILTLLSLIAAASEDEGTLGTDPFWRTFAKLFNLFRFPTHTIFWYLMIDSGRLLPIFFFGGLIINCGFYGLAIERLVAVFTLAVKKVITVARAFF